MCIIASNRQRIEKVLKKAIRIITNSAYAAHTKPLFIQHAILPFDKLEDTRQKNRDLDPAVNLHNADGFYISQPRTETFKKSTYYAIPTAWNELIPEIKLQENKFMFKWARKAHLLDEIADI
jgi:hypothetical protein